MSPRERKCSQTSGWGAVIRLVYVRLTFGQDALRLSALLANYQLHFSIAIGLPKMHTTGCLL